MLGTVKTFTNTKEKRSQIQTTLSNTKNKILLESGTYTPSLVGAIHKNTGFKFQSHWLEKSQSQVRFPNTPHLPLKALLREITHY